MLKEKENKAEENIKVKLVNPNIIEEDVIIVPNDNSHTHQNIINDEELNNKLDIFNENNHKHLNNNSTNSENYHSHEHEHLRHHHKKDLKYYMKLNS